MLQTFLPYAFFLWCENTALGVWLKGTTWGFAVIETVHIMALAVLLGSMLVIDLRLMGLGLKRQSTIELAGLLRPWFWGALATMVASGICLFISEALRLRTSGPFAYKMLFLLLAVTIYLTIHRTAIARGREGAALAKTAAWLSLISWLGIALAGRAIAFL
ncbi:MAG TPA: DUF6644 family protein [Bryobacteraceae bacterium]|nr:DUF6644 family protein [Bryobacteraceae bacterium]